MRRMHWGAAIAVVLAVAGCWNNKAGSDGVDPGEHNKWKDPNIEIIPIGSVNYTDYAIYGIYLMPPGKSNIDLAARASVGEPQPRGATNWEMRSSGPAVAWDLRWKVPKRFKVWWERVVDKGKYLESGPFPKGGGMFDPYDPYVVKPTRPGSAWCEGEVTINEQFGEPYGEPFPNLFRRELVLYFYPDGTVQGTLEFGGFEGIKLFDIAKRNELPVLKGQACLTEVPNPLFGKPRPRSFN